MCPLAPRAAAVAVRLLHPAACGGRRPSLLSVRPHCHLRLLLALGGGCCPVLSALAVAGRQWLVARCPPPFLLVRCSVLAVWPPPVASCPPAARLAGCCCCCWGRVLLHPPSRGPCRGRSGEPLPALAVPLGLWVLAAPPRLSWPLRSVGCAGRGLLRGGRRSASSPLFVSCSPLVGAAELSCSSGGGCVSGVGCHPSLGTSSGQFGTQPSGGHALVRAAGWS